MNAVNVFESEGIAYETGSHTDRVFDCELIITSPGVPSNSEILIQASKNNIKVVSEVEFASWFCKGKIISVTGTNGKTTTTSLCSYTLNECGLVTHLAGNIGTAFSDVVLSVGSNEFIALETSSFQLDYIDSFKPVFSMILNITPDHLDRYNNSFDEYKNSKYVIAKNQDENDFFIFNADDKNSFKGINNSKVNRIGFSIKDELKNGSFCQNEKLMFAHNGNMETICASDELYIKGEHNIANALAVLNVAKTLNLSSQQVKKAFESFKGVEHRLEFVRELDGVKYINDSKATNVDSVWYALRSFKEPLYLILGGKDKGNNYDQIKDLVKGNVKKIYAIGSSAEKVYNYFKNMVEVELRKSLEDCVHAARVEAVPGSVVLLSPACASFDMFENYEHRGKVFKQAVNELK